MITDPDSKDIFLRAHEVAVREMRASYQIVRQTRTEVGIHVPSYEEWLESELELYKALVDYYRNKPK